MRHRHTSEHLDAKEQADILKSKVSFQGVIDRIEGDRAVVLNGEGEMLVELPVAMLPEGTKEGSIVEIQVRVKKNKGKEAKQKVARMIEKLKDR